MNAESPLLARIRFGPERDLIEMLFERFGLEDVLAHYLASGKAVPHDALLLGSQLRLTRLLAPRLIALLDEVTERLGFSEPIHLFVQPSAEINAFSLHALGDRPHAISLNSGLVERMDDHELRFVLGHEVGHLAWRHHRGRLIPLALGEDEDGESRVPPLLARRIESWDRLAELSADRAGFLATGEDLTHVVPAFFKLVGGLGPQHLRFDLSAFLEQLSELQRLERRELLATFSHPATPVRVRALQRFGEAGGSHAQPEALAAVDHEVAQLARLMDLQISEPIEIHSRDFLVAGGLLAAQVGGREIDRKQADWLLHLVLPLAADPEEELAKVRDAREAEAMLARATGWLRENAGAERFILYGSLCHVVAMDGALSEAERDFMIELAARLDIPESTARQMLYEAVGGWLEAQASERRPTFGFTPALKPS